MRRGVNNCEEKASWKALEERMYRTSCDSSERSMMKKMTMKTITLMPGGPDGRGKVIPLLERGVIPLGGST